MKVATTLRSFYKAGLLSASSKVIIDQDLICSDNVNLRGDTFWVKAVDLYSRRDLILFQLIGETGTYTDQPLTIGGKLRVKLVTEEYEESGWE